MNTEVSTQELNTINGGSAFPVTEQKNINGEFSTYAETGMTLRDYFAAKVLQGLCSNPSFEGIATEIEFAQAAYKQADAMIEVRDL